MYLFENKNVINVGVCFIVDHILTPKPKENISRINLICPNLNINELMGRGCPDFFMYDPNNKNIYFFVEAKHANDALQVSQIEWICKHKDLPYILALVYGTMGVVNEVDKG